MWGMKRRAAEPIRWACAVEGPQPQRRGAVAAVGRVRDM